MGSNILMAMPANLRVNVPTPFPALVSGVGGVTVTKNNGVWTIGLSAGAIQSIIQTLGIVPVTVGTATLNFGVNPGTTDVSLVVTGQTSILSASNVEAFIIPAATADHSIDEHWNDAPLVYAGNIVAGIGFTIYGRTAGNVYGANDPSGTQGPGLLTYGAWNVGWRWQ
jgi:hypothetical protein